MTRKAILLWVNDKETVFIYMDEASMDTIRKFLESRDLFLKKFRYVIDALLHGVAT